MQFFEAATKGRWGTTRITPSTPRRIIKKKKKQNPTIKQNTTKHHIHTHTENPPHPPQSHLHSLSSNLIMANIHDLCQKSYCQVRSKHSCLWFPFSDLTQEVPEARRSHGSCSDTKQLKAGSTNIKHELTSISSCGSTAGSTGGGNEAKKYM